MTNWLVLPNGDAISNNVIKSVSLHNCGVAGTHITVPSSSVAIDFYHATIDACSAGELTNSFGQPAAP